MTTKTDQLIAHLVNHRDGERKALDEAIASGLSDLDPFRNWLEGRYLAAKRAVEIAEVWA